MPQPYPICKRCCGLYEQGLGPSRLGLCPDCRVMKDTAELNNQKLDRIIELLEQLVQQQAPLDDSPSECLICGYDGKNTDKASGLCPRCLGQCKTPP